LLKHISYYVNPRGVSLINTISCAELAAIAAAIIHGYSHIATDSLTSMHRIKKQLSHPNLHCHHIQGLALQSITKAIHQSPSPIHFHEVKSHAGFIGNEFADALATKSITTYSDTKPYHNLLCGYLHRNSWPQEKSLLQHLLACKIV